MGWERAGRGWGRVGMFLAAGAVLAAGAWSFSRHAETHWKRARDTWAGHLEAMADDRARAIDQWLRGGLANAATVASYPTAAFVLRGTGPRTFPAEEGARDHLNRLLGAAVSGHGYAAGALVDTELGLVAVQGEPPPGFAERAANAARPVLADGVARVDVSDFSQVAPGVLFVAPVRADAGETALGAVVLVADPEKSLFPLLAAEPRPTSTGEVMLARREGGEAVFLGSARFLPGAGLSLRRSLDTPRFAMRIALDGEGTFGEFVDYRGTPVLAATRRLTMAPWGLVAKIDRSEAYAADRRHLLLEGTALGFALAAIAGLVFGLARHLRAVYSVALLRASARAAALFDHSNDAILFVGADGRIREANRRAAVFYGVPREALVGRSVVDLRAEDERDVARTQLERVLQEGSLMFEGHHQDATGRRLPVEISSRLVHLEEEPLIVSIVRDVRERKEHEARIGVLNRLYQTLSEVNQLIVRGVASPQALFEGACRILTEVGGFPLAVAGVRSDDGSVQIVALDGAAAAYGRTIDLRWDEIAPGRGPAGAAPGDGHPVVVADLSADPALAPWASTAPAHGLATVGVFPVLVDGDATAVIAVYGAEAGAIGETLQGLLQKLAEDIGFALASHHVAEDRERTQAALHALFRSDAVGILFGTVDGRVLDANDTFLRMIGYSRAELERGEVHWTDITPPEHLPKDDAAVAEARERGSCTPYEKEYVRKDGRRIRVLVGFALLEPERVRSVATIHDVTLTRAAEEEIRRLNGELESRVRERTAELEAANVDLEAFSYSVSHDLRAPLRAIDGFSRALEEEHAQGLDPEGRRLLGMLREGAARMGRLIEDLLAFSKAGRQELRQQRVDMGPLAREAFEDLAAEHEIAGLELRIGHLEPVQGDPALLRQVWLNLLSNALKFTRGRRPRLIEVRSTVGDREVRYSVRDTGVGFEARDASRLFKVFQRLHSTGEFAGTGVGLALVRRIVVRHGGAVGAEGQPGEGALFWFSLPRAEG